MASNKEPRTPKPEDRATSSGSAYVRARETTAVMNPKRKLIVEKILTKRNEKRLTRREVIAGSLKTLLAASVLPLVPAEALSGRIPLRTINIMNFIRAVDPRDSINLMQPVKEQMAHIKAHEFPATWLLQYDALVMGPFVDFLKAEMPPHHETGIWFEMNRKICDDAGIAWRGHPKWEWDYHVPVDYAIGYSPDERRKLADTAMATFRRIFGHDAKTIGSWMLDAVTAAHLSDQYGMDAFANCRDQLATDGFTIWGAPIAAYYPNRKNAYSPALNRRNQISTPMFRLLGQDPVYYYEHQLPYPDTMEPVWPSGQSPVFVQRFLNMIADAPTQSVAYAQLGQENSFGWARMRKAYPMQMEKLAKERRDGGLIVETMGETGRRFKRLFPSTPTQAQVMLEDPFGHDHSPERTIWYQSKYFRANLHFRGDLFYLRDLHVYHDQFSQLDLTEPARSENIEQRMLAVLDGYHWSDKSALAGHSGTRAMGRFVLISSDGKVEPLAMKGMPAVKESRQTLRAEVPFANGGRFVSDFREREIAFSLKNVSTRHRLGLVFDWVDNRTAFQHVSADRLNYRFRDFDYSVRVINGVPSEVPGGVKIVGAGQGALRLQMAQ